MAGVVKRERFNRVVQSPFYYFVEFSLALGELATCCARWVFIRSCKTKLPDNLKRQCCCIFCPSSAWWNGVHNRFCCPERLRRISGHQDGASFRIDSGTATQPSSSRGGAVFGETSFFRPLLIYQCRMSVPTVYRITGLPFVVRAVSCSWGRSRLITEGPLLQRVF